MANFIDPSKIEHFKLLQLEGKRLASVGDLKASLEKFELAKQICPTSKVLQRIQKLKECLKNFDHTEKDQALPRFSSTASFAEVNSENPIISKCTDASAIELHTSNSTKIEPKVLIEIQNIQSNKKSGEKKSESSDLSPQSQLKFKQLKNKAKQLAYAGQHEEAVNCFKQALNIFDCPNVKRYIKEIQSLILTDSQQAKELDDYSIKKHQHVSDSVRESPDSNPAQSEQSGDVFGFKDQLIVKKHSSYSVEESVPQKSSGSYSVEESVPQKSSVSDFENETDVERKLDEVKFIYEEARVLAADGKLKDALKLLKEAQSIHKTQKVQKRIDKLEEIIAADLNDTEENKMIEISKGFSIYHEIYNKLYPYQREGVAWMWKLYKMGCGGVLGDDMGLGKTFQVIAFISGMIDADLVKHVLIIMPVSLLKNWEKEFKKWCPGISVYDFHSGSKKERERNKLRVQRRGHVLLTSYGMIVNNVNLLTEMEGSEFVWDYVILDEGHKIKNPTKTTKAVHDIPTKNRLVLTGTPIQNNLKELWSLYNFVHQGTLLGSLKTFKLQYENPITRSREKDATAGEKLLGSKMAENLKELIKLYFLRRTKSEVWGNNDDSVKELETQMENMKISRLTAKKNDFILWTFMSEPQIAIYQDFLHSDAVKSILVSKRSPLVELTTLKKICDHPRLLSQRACFHLGLNGDLQHADQLDLDDESTLASSIDNVTDDSLLKESGKLKLVIDLLENLKEAGHRTLVFSLSRKVLDMIHRILVNRKWKVMRLDGTIAKTEDREKRIMQFQRDPSYPVFLLTTQVGGVGITLTAADRVIIYDPSWNPATDAQAVDRAYRIGQQKDVIVYRLITCGTVEEKIYRRQIFKDSITRQATGVADPYRYFSKQELRELFSLDDPLYSATQVQLHEMHSSQRSTSDELEKHLEFLRQLNIFGISDHNLMFSKHVEDETEDNDPNAISEHFIKQKVAAAHAQIQMEGSVVAEGMRLAGTFNRPYQEAIPLYRKNLTKDPYKPPSLPDVIDLTEDAQSNVLSNGPERRSYSPEDDIQIISSKSINRSILSGEQHLSPIHMKPESVLSKLNRLSSTASPSKPSSQHNVTENSSNSENAVQISQKFGANLENISFSNTEKLRKSSFVKSPSKDRYASDLLENPSVHDDANLDETSVQYANKQSIDDEQTVSAVSKPSDVTSDMKEKFHANVTQFMNDDIADFSFNEEGPAVSVKKGRKSCARQSTMLISESDTSCPNSASNSNISLDLVNESEEIDSDYDDSSNSASVSFIPDSTANTPQASKNDHKYIQHSVNTTPSAHLEPELLSGKKSSRQVIPDHSNLRRQEGNFERITPLKVDRNTVQEDSSFMQAMANSLIITPESSPKNEQMHVQTVASSDEEDDSPVKFIKKKAVRQMIDSDSDESDTNSNIRNKYNSYDKNKKCYQDHLKSFSDEEKGKSYSQNIEDEVLSDEEEENDHSKIDENREQQDEVLSEEEKENDHSKIDDNREQQDEVLSEEEKEHDHSKNDDNEEQQDEVSSDEEEEHDHSENDDNREQLDKISSDLDEEQSHSEYDDNGEQQGEVLSNQSSEDESDLEQTFATCKDKPESDSEDVSSSEASGEYSDSDESGSLFSEDD